MKDGVKSIKKIDKIYHLHNVYYRFIYVCYASGLLKEGVTLLHWIVMLVCTIMCINSTIVHPIRCTVQLYILPKIA